MKKHKIRMATKAKQRSLNAFLFSKDFFDFRVALFSFFLGVFITCMITY